MKIIVCVKQVPDSAATMSVVDGKITWGDAPLVINPWDEYAVEAALRLTEAQGGEVVALSLGDENAKEAIKHALAMGCSEAILVNDPAMAGADTQAVARVLAAAIQKIGDANIVVFGKQAIDSDVGATPAMVARLLGWPAVTLVSEITECSDSQIKAARAMEEGRQQIEASLPVVLSIVKDYGEPRYPSFMGIRKAARAEVPEWSVADTGIEVPTAIVTWPKVMAPPERQVTNEIIEGGSPEEIAAKLADKIMEEKVL
ncbi:MAG: electron transfer flavoprotein subunit beta/FixA family protein [Anaerolineales bacterium]